jgi:hypothetical protein
MCLKQNGVKGKGHCKMFRQCYKGAAEVATPNKARLKMMPLYDRK